MAQLNDTMVQGDLRVTGKIYGTGNAIRVEDANLAIPPLGVGDSVGSTGDFFTSSGSGKNLPNTVDNFVIHTTVTHYASTTYRLSQIATPTSSSNPSGIYERGASSSDGVTWTFGSWLAAASSSHTHGNIANGGTLTDTAAAAAGNDYVVIRDADNAKIQTSTIKGTDVADAVSKKHSHSTLTLSTTAQAYDGSHTLALPSSDPYSSARTPTSHASTDTTYGAGTTANYGHVKLVNSTPLTVGTSSDDGVATGKAHIHNALESVERKSVTTADLEHINTNSRAHMILSQITNSTSTTHDPGDGYMLSFMWDNTGKYDTQVFIPDGMTSSTDFGRLKIRYCNNSAWGDWEYMPPAFRATLLTSADDLDTLKGDGFGNILGYRWESTSTPTHTAFSDNHGAQLLVFGTSGTAYATQIEIRSDKGIYQRRLVNDVWGAWEKILVSSDISDAAQTYFAIVTQSTFEDVKAAYNAGKRIVGVIGGTASGGKPFRQETPLAFVFFSDNEPFSFVFLFENARPKTEPGEGVGSTTKWTLSSSGWATSTDNVDYAETAGTANTSQTANKLSTVDTAPKKGSSNMVTSDGLWNDTPSPIAYYFDGDINSIFGVYNGSKRADEVVVRQCKRFRLTTSWLKNFSGRTFKIHNANSSNLALTAQVEAGLKLTITDEFSSPLQTVDNTSGTSTIETKNPIMSLLPGETLRLFVIYSSGTTNVALFIVGSGRWSVFSPPYDKYRRVESISSYFQRLCYAKTTGSPGSKGNVHLYDGNNWHNLCNITDDPGIVRIGGLDSSRTPDNPVDMSTYDGYMNIVTGLTLTRNGYMGMLYGYVAPKQTIALRLPTTSSDTATSFFQSGKTLANCSELRIDGFDTDAVGAGHAVFTSSSLLHITLLSGTLTFAIAGDFSVFTTGASYFFSIPISFGNLKG